MHDRVALLPHQPGQLAQGPQIVHGRYVAQQMRLRDDRPARSADLILDTSFRPPGRAADKVHLVAFTVRKPDGMKGILLRAPRAQARDHVCNTNPAHPRASMA